MKKFAILLLMSCFALTAAAQDETAEAENVKNVRKKFFNISYLSDKIKFSEGNIGLNNAFDEVEGIANDKNIGIKNNWGISLTRGRSYMLHKKPIARLISIGIDASFFDVSYSNYTASFNDLGASDLDLGELEDFDADDLNDKMDFHKMEYSFQVGPSITITPGQKLTVAAYFRYAPTFSCLYVDETFAGQLRFDVRHRSLGSLRQDRRRHRGSSGQLHLQDLLGRSRLLGQQDQDVGLPRLYPVPLVEFCQCAKREEFPHGNSSLFFLYFWSQKYKKNLFPCFSVAKSSKSHPTDSDVDVRTPESGVGRLFAGLQANRPRRSRFQPSVRFFAIGPSRESPCGKTGSRKSRWKLAVGIN